MKPTMIWRLALFLPCLAAHATAQQPLPGLTADELPTVAESSDYEATATYDEVLAFCKALGEKTEVVHLTDFGESVEGRKLPLLVIANPPIESPAALAESGKLPVFVMANIHAGEVCGKEAALMLARELAADKDNGLLRRITLLIAPIYNADGNERFSKDNRPGQLGPARGMGQRRNMQDLDLNRDHVKLESPEARSLARLITDWNPAILIDTHTTNGSYHRYAVTYDGPRHPATPGEITPYARDKFLPSVDDHMEQNSDYATFFYGNFDEAHQQWTTYPDWPRYSIQYFGLRGRIGILSEAYAYATYRDRVLATKQFVESCCHVAAEEADSIRALLDSARAEPKRVAIQSESVPLDRPFDVLGYVETTKKDGRRVATDKQRTYTGVRYLGLSKPAFSVAAPDAYVIPSDLENVIENLTLHGVDFERVSADREVEAQRYIVKRIQRAEREFQGHRTVKLDIERETGQHEIKRGDVLVKVDQPLGALVVNLLEPESQDGLVTWNFFDEHLEEGAFFPVVRLEKAP